MYFVRLETIRQPLVFQVLESAVFSSQMLSTNSPMTFIQIHVIITQIFFTCHYRRYSALGLYSMSELQRVKHFELLCLGSHLGLHLKRRGGSELGFTNFYKFFCKYANPPPAKYTPTVGVISGCQFPLLPDVVDQHSSEHPGNWKKDCQFWIETSFEHHFSGFFESTHVLV